MTRRRVPPAQRFHTGEQVSHCKGCGAAILWLRHANGKLAPIDARPVPDGNVLVDAAAGTYSVIPKAELALFDATRAVGPDAKPTLHINHWVTCGNMTYRRLARERAAGHTGPLEADDVPVHPVDRNADALTRHAIDPLAAPVEVAARHARCDVCSGPLDARLYAAGIRTHPAC